MHVSNPIKSFRDLEVWQFAVDLSVDVYRATQAFPKYEMYGLSSQIQRSSTSISANIAEGHARQHTGEFLQSLSIARGSLAELQTQAVIAFRLGYISQETEEDLSSKADTVSRMLAGLRSALRAKQAKNPR